MQQEKDQATKDALNWLIALQEDERDEELQQRFEAWHGADADHRRAWDECQHVWETLGALEALASPPTPARDSLSTTRQTIASSFGVRRPRPCFLFAMIAAGSALCLAIIYRPVISSWLAADYSTGIAQTREVKLDDGSTVYLGADSSIAVSMETATRKVTLLSGEAYFEVAPNPTRPFSVETDNVETKVLGTGFNVRRSAEGVNVAVNHGRVAVSGAKTNKDLETPLAAGDWVDVGWDGRVQRGNDAPELAGGWRSGMLVVKDRPVVDVIREIGRHYPGKIVSVDAKLDGLRVTGVYDLTHPVEALNAVVQAHGGRVHQVTSWVAVVSRW